MNFTIASNSFGEFLSICNEKERDGTLEILCDDDLENSFKELVSHKTPVWHVGSLVLLGIIKTPVNDVLCFIFKFSVIHQVPLLLHQ